MSTATDIPRLKARYNEQIRDQLKADLGLGNIMEVPRLEKIVINMGVGGAVSQASLLENAVKDLTLIAGQKPQITRQGHPPGRSHVGVPRSPDRPGDPPHP